MYLKREYEMINMNPIWRRICFVCLVLGILASVRCQSPNHSKNAQLMGRGDLRIGLDSETGLPETIISKVGNQKRTWLSGPVMLTVTDEASQKQEQVSGAVVRVEKDGVESTSDLALLGISLSHRLQVADNKAVWEMTFTGDGKRTGHEIKLELPVVFPGARIFTPSQYGVMDVNAYPTFEPVPYATYAWNDGQSYVLPLVSIMDPGSDNAFTVALPADDNIPHLQIAWSDARVLSLRMGHRGKGSGQPTTVRLLFYVHPADYRSVLKAYADDFPAYFRPPLPRGPYEGTFWYHHIEDHPDFEEMARQHVRYMWSSFCFPYMGEFMPESREWYPYTYALEWAFKKTMTDDTLKSFIGKMNDRGIGVYAYLNVTEYGGAGGKEGTTARADSIIEQQLADALVRNAEGKPIGTWAGSKVINPGPAYSYWPVLMGHIRRHLDRVPEFEGFMVDRLDWASGFDFGHNDGLSMDGEVPMENLAVPVSAALQEISRMVHEAGQRIFVNQFWRVELVRDADGYCHENDYLPAMAYLAPYRPASAWNERYNYHGDLLPFEAQMKRRLQWALFPQMIAHEFPICQQPPNPRAADLMELFAPVFEPLMGKEQVLIPHCVSVTGPNDVNLFINGNGHYVAPVTSRVRFLCRPPQVLEPTEVTLHVPDAAKLSWAHVFSVDGSPYRAPVESRRGEAVVTLEKHGTSSMIVVGKGQEPPLEQGDAARLDAIRMKLFPSVQKEESVPERPDLKDITEIELEVSGTRVGASYPSTVVEVFVDGRRTGNIRDAQSWFKRTTVATELPEQPPVISLLPGDEGTWLVPEKAKLVVRMKDGRTYRVASWERSDACGADGIRGLRLPLSWREISPVAGATARFNAKDVRTGGSWVGKVGGSAYWMSGFREGEPQSGFGMKVAKGRGHAWSYRVRGDSRVLQHSADASYSRRATCWLDTDHVDIRVVPPDDTPYRLSVYILDYDHTGLAEKVLVLSGQEILDEREVSADETEKGVYLSWKAVGPIIISARKTAGTNAAVSGVFVDRP